MLFDPKIEVICDNQDEGCIESIYIEPEYVYMSISGAGGHYDCSDKASFDSTY